MHQKHLQQLITTKLKATILTLIYLLSVAQTLPTDLEVCAPPNPAPEAPVKPTPNSVANGKGLKEVPCNPVSKYSVIWILVNTSIEGGPKPSTCLFHSRGLSLKQEHTQRHINQS